MTSTFQLSTVSCMLFAGILAGQSNGTPSEEGIPVTDPVVITKCRSCHASDEHGNMQRISWERTTPEDWQEVLKRMILADGVTLTPTEARAMVKYLSAKHGLAPQEAEPVRYAVERRIHDESSILNEDFRGACAKCHALARPLSWRRSREDWQELAK